ncbi:Endopolygalacturonase B [Phytophthora ramorum]|nr:Endopolygalacturonase B [Phytophthora ramorum]
MKFFFPTIVVALLASAAQAGPMVQQGTTKCNSKTAAPSTSTVSTSTAGSSEATTSTPTATTATTSVAASASTDDTDASIGAEADDSAVSDYLTSSSASTGSYSAASTSDSTQYSSSTYSSYTSTDASAASTTTDYTSSSSASETTDYSSTAASAAYTSTAASEAASTAASDAYATSTADSAASAAATTASSSTNTTTTAACTLSGTYSDGTDVSSCSSIVISDLTVPKGVTLDLTNVADGATITFEGTTTFGEEEWDGPLILLTGNDLTVTGTGTLDGQGSWYWEQGTSISKPVFFRLKKVMSSTLESFNIKNSPYRTFSILDCEDTTLTGLTLDSSAGDDTAKNTDGFDLSRNVGLTISDCTVYNQDDCLAMQSSNDTTFSGNTCSGGHGISIGSLGGDSVTESDIVSGLTVKNNKIIDSVNGIRIKTIIDLYGTVTGASYTDNTLSNVENAIVIHSDYSKSEGGYTGDATSKVAITDITISGLSGTADDIYDILVNADVVSGWTFSDITVTGDTGSCSGEPSGVDC